MADRELRPRPRGPPPLRRLLRLALPLLLLLVLLLPTAAAARSVGAPAAAGGAPPGELVVVGVVEDQYSGQPIAGVTVDSLGNSLVWDNTTTDAQGRFSVETVPGPLNLRFGAPSGFDSLRTVVVVSNTSNPPLTIGLLPQALLNQVSGATDAAWEASALVGAVAVGVGIVVAAPRRRTASGARIGLLSPFGRYVAGRLILIPFQLFALLVLLYIFGNFLPALGRASVSGCLAAPGGSCATCLPAALSCQVSFFGSGFVGFASNLLTGNWGLASIGALRLPAVDFLTWWLPYSIELAVFALAISVAIAYPLGLAAGWQEGSPLDRGTRGTSLALLLIPTFLVALFLVLLVFQPWNALFGDSPYGLLPSPGWFVAHGGFLPWIGVGGQTSPTGFPLVDGLIHGDGAFVLDVLVKNLLQAALIAAIYVGIFFRYVRQSVAEAARSISIRAARSRGIPESTLLWRHTGRRLIPVYLLTFGMTLPAYLGTQALVEAMFNDQPGIGTILFSEMTGVSQTGFGYAHLGPLATGNLYQVIILFLALTLLLGNLCADVLARYLDPTIAAEARR